ncbi:MAG: S8 family serine peptidase [Clostridia bacterium]|nr:S8 family serine peptidase [Clostridia bacterium]
MKKLYSLIIAFTILLSTVSVSTYATPDTTKSPYIESNVFEEETVLCHATIDDNFRDDSLIVIFKNKDSKNLETYNTDFFPEITATSIQDLTSHSKKKIKEQRNKNIQSELTSASKVSATYDEMYVDENKFHQIVKINLKSKSKENVLKCIKKLEARDDILMALPNYIYKPTLTANDPAYNNTNGWAIGQINLPAAWNTTTGSASTKVGVIDSGIDGDHVDLVNRVNSTLSYDFTGGNSPLTDTYGHGTKIAGVIGAQSNNSVGVTGTCWNVSLVSLKAGGINNKGEYEISLDELKSVIDYATGNNIPILNFSYFGEDDFHNALKISLQNYKGLLICSAGNDGQDISNFSLDLFDYNDNIIVVAGTDSDDLLFNMVGGDGKTYASNYSSTKVDLAAPGEEILTTSSNGSYVEAHGTSLAAPYVTGVAALLKSQYPKMDAGAIKDNIINNVDYVPELAGKVSTSGRLNAYKALSNPEKFTVRYIPNGGGGSTMQNSEIIRGCSTALRANTYTRDGYTFNYWYAKRPDSGLWYYTNGTDKDWYPEGQQPPGYYKYPYRDKQTVSRTAANGKYVEMYAQWKIDKFNLTFNSNNGTKTMPYLTVDYDDSFNIPSNVFYREGFTFDHWYAKNQDGNLYYVNGNNGGWYTIDSRPSGYTRLDIADKSNISYDTFNDISNGDTITLCAYWKPNSGELGDADNSGKVNITDATHIQNYLSNTVDEGDINLSLADVNFDGEVTISDVTILNKFLAKLIDEFGV